MTEAERLRKIRDGLAAIEPGQWSLAAEGETAFVEARGGQGELIRILDFRRSATPDEIEFVSNAPETVRFLLKLVDRAIEAMRPRRPEQSAPKPETPKDFAAEAAMKCQEPAFKKYLEERHGLERPLTDDRAAQKLRSLLGISSRKKLNDDAAAAERWRRLRDDFQTWRRVG